MFKVLELLTNYKDLLKILIDKRNRKKLLLVTTALEKTWGCEEDILFLGEWCRRYLRQEAYDHRKYEVVRNHWDDRDKLESDESNLRHLHDTLVKSLTVVLNDIHSVSYSERYWQILLDPWLVYYVAIIWDRWECIRICLKEYQPTKTFNVVAKSESKVPRDHAAALELYLDDIWNHQIYVDILSQIEPQKCEVIFLDIESELPDPVEVGVGSNPSSGKWVVIKFIDDVLSKFSSGSGISFGGFISPFLLQAKLQLRLGQIPISNFSLIKDLRPAYGLSDKSLRKRASDLLGDNSPQTDGFQNFLISRLLFDAPSSILEDFGQLRRAANLDKRRPRVILSSYYHWTSDPFKAWVADRVENGAQLVIVEHGGAIVPRFDIMDFEDRIADKKITWYKPYLPNQVRLPAAKLIGSKVTKLRRGSGCWCLIVGFENPRYVYRATAAPHAGQCLAMYSSIVKLIETISSEELKASVKIRPYPNMGWDLEARFQDELGTRYIQNDCSLYQAYNDAKVIVCTYPNTTLSEGMVSGRPTLLLYEKSLWELHDHFKPLLEVLRRAKIVHDDPVSLSTHLDKIWSDPESWWSSIDVVRAREAFSDMVISVPEDAIQKWVKFLKLENTKFH
jgi:putative transferase (TIGR04331 family)